MQLSATGSCVWPRLSKVSKVLAGWVAKPSEWPLDSDEAMMAAVDRLWLCSFVYRGVRGAQTFICAG